MNNFEKVKKFMQTFGQEVKSKPSFPNDKIIKLRYELIEEELSELRVAIKDKDITEVADALTDILYVTYGAGHSFGINLDRCFEEVQNSNMSKLGDDGKPIFNEVGKVMKGPNYYKPNYHGNESSRQINYPFMTDIQFIMNQKQTWIDQRQTNRWKLVSLFPNLYTLINTTTATYIGRNHGNFFGKERINLKQDKYSELSNPIEKSAAERWEININRLHAIAHNEGIRYIVFLQPTMGLSGPHSLPARGSSDEVIFNSIPKDYIGLMREFYKELKIRCARLDFCFDITDVASPTGDVYFNARHHNSKGNHILAKVIAKHIAQLDSSK